MLQSRRTGWEEPMEVLDRLCLIGPVEKWGESISSAVSAAGRVNPPLPSFGVETRANALAAQAHRGLANPGCRWCERQLNRRKRLSKTMLIDPRGTISTQVRPPISFAPSTSRNTIRPWSEIASIGPCLHSEILLRNEQSTAPIIWGARQAHLLL